jgi:hypothetical protein
MLSLFYFRYHILYPGFSKITIVNNNGGVSSFTIPNEMVDRIQNPPIHGEVSFIFLNLEPDMRSGNGPKYMITLEGNTNDIFLKILLPGRIAEMKEAESDFLGYKKYYRYSPAGTSSFYLVGKERSGYPIYIQCHHNMQVSQKSQRLHKCTYYGIYNEKLEYEFMFPGYELEKIDDLIVYAENKITDLLDKE